MYTIEIEPRFNDTDALGHINNAAFITWMEESRRPVFKLFNRELSISKWNLILARVEMDYLAQCYFGKTVIIETFVEKIGRSSVTLGHSMFQKEIKTAKGKSTLVYFDYQKVTPLSIPKDIRDDLLLEFSKTAL